MAIGRTVSRRSVDPVFHRIEALDDLGWTRLLVAQMACRLGLGFSGIPVS